MAKAGVAKGKGGALELEGDGVTVVEGKGGFEVAFAFSSTQVAKIKTVPGAEFADEVWKVPASSRDTLAAAVEDMRDFNRQGGVQVKDTEKGKLVIFDYDKNLSRLIGPVAGAEFSREAGGWLVPLNSKALEAEQGQASFFDRAINTMRGTVIDIEKDYEAIKTHAAKSAEERKLKPGLHHPQPDHSYTGPIVHANGYWAAQLSGVDEEKGVAFITLHKQVELGEEVFKGDNLRIDYGQNREVKVRSVEVFQAQQKEREELRELAGAKIEGATVLNGSTKPGQEYHGRVIEVGKYFALQHEGRDRFVIHDLGNLKGAVHKDHPASIKFDKNGVGVIAEKQVAQGVAR